MDFKQLYSDKFTISFEIFPPKTESGEINLFSELRSMVTYKPGFISVTYGAGGSTRDKTIELALKIRDKFDITPLVHFTCVGAGKNEIEEYLQYVDKLGLNNILALRGDVPAGEKEFSKPENGFSYANELVEFIKSIGSFSIAVAGYPEKHAEADSFEMDIDNLKKKIDAGGEVIITQLFLANEAFYRYSDMVKRAGINVPVIPGIMPLTNARQIERMVDLSGAGIPGALKSILDKCSSDNEILEAGIEFAVRQCDELIKFGVPGFHFYPLNKSEAVSKILDILKL
ncbi:MAG: methylenetetrahydrofolate reductase [NAD(P)H] [Spirochaetes bacterium]|nr:methylenetetrahydrofolate reductase [NAD(P)H] [Spirochaetota bacterium]